MKSAVLMIILIISVDFWLYNSSIMVQKIQNSGCEAELTISEGYTEMVGDLQLLGQNGENDTTENFIQQITRRNITGRDSEPRYLVTHEFHESLTDKLCVIGSWWWFRTK